MSQKHDPKHHDHQHGHEHHYDPQKAKERALHKDWRTWAVVLLMVALIFAYLASQDERLSPVRQGQGPMPADAPVAPPPAAP